MQGLSVLNSISRLELCAGSVPARGNVRTWEGASVAEGVIRDDWKLFSHKGMKLVLVHLIACLEFAVSIAQS